MTSKEQTPQLSLQEIEKNKTIESIMENANGSWRDMITEGYEAGYATSKATVGQQVVEWHQKLFSWLCNTFNLEYNDAQIIVDHVERYIHPLTSPATDLLPNLDKSTENWSKVKDKDEWLNEVRGATVAPPVSGKEVEEDIEVRVPKLWPPDKKGWYWCVIEGRPKALGMRLVRLEYGEDDLGKIGFLQDDDNFRVLYYLTATPIKETVTDGVERDNDTKYTYYHIDFSNCCFEGDYTICESLEQVAEVLQYVDIDFDDPEKSATVEIKGVGMTPIEYKEWLKENDGYK